MKKTITVFGSAFPKEGDEEYEFAYELGQQLSLNNFNLCTGGYYGIMEAISKGAFENKAEVFGVTVNYFERQANNFVTTEIKCDSLFERITKLIELGDAYIILKGGTGTLLELAAVWEFMNKKLLKTKPVICNSSMWKKIIPIIDERLQYENRKTGLIKNCDSLEEIITYLNKVI